MRRWSTRRTTAYGHRTLHLRPGGSRAAVGRGSHGRLRGCRASLDDAALQFLLQQSLLARAEEEEQAREEAEVQELEQVVAQRMQRLAELVDEVARRDGYRLSPNLSALERTACALVADSEALRKKKENWKKRRRRIRYRPGFLVSCSS